MKNQLIFLAILFILVGFSCKKADPLLTNANVFLEKNKPKGIIFDSIKVTGIDTVTEKKLFLKEIIEETTYCTGLSHKSLLDLKIMGMHLEKAKILASIGANNKYELQMAQENRKKSEASHQEALSTNAEIEKKRLLIPTKDSITPVKYRVWYDIKARKEDMGVIEVDCCLEYNLLLEIISSSKEIREYLAYKLND